MLTGNILATNLLEVTEKQLKLENFPLFPEVENMKLQTAAKNNKNRERPQTC